MFGVVVDHFHSIKQSDVVNIMHDEVAYKEAAVTDIILYKYAQHLSIA